MEIHRLMTWRTKGPVETGCSHRCPAADCHRPGSKTLRGSKVLLGRVEAVEGGDAFGINFPLPGGTVHAPNNFQYNGDLTFVLFMSIIHVEALVGSKGQVIAFTYFCGHLFVFAVTPSAQTINKSDAI